MQLPRLRLPTLLTLVSFAIVLVSGAIAFVDRKPWIEFMLRGWQFDVWIESPWDWLLLGVLSVLLVWALFGLTLAIRSRLWRRLTTRHLLAVVAVAAILMAGLARLRQRADRFQGLALTHQRATSDLIISELEVYLLLTVPQGGYDDPREDEERHLAAAPLLLFIDYHSGLATKYEHAARRPWLLVPADPPPPPKPSAELQEALRKRAYEGDAIYVPCFQPLPSPSTER